MQPQDPPLQPGGAPRQPAAPPAARLRAPGDVRGALPLAGAKRGREAAAGARFRAGVTPHAAGGRRRGEAAAGRSTGRGAAAEAPPRETATADRLSMEE